MNQGRAVTLGAQSFDLLRMDRQIQVRQTRRRLAKVAGWAGLIAFALSRRGVLGWVVAAGGVYALVDELFDWRDERPEWKKGARHVTGGVLHRLMTPRDRGNVGSESELSFPASDPTVGAPR
jgi:hypothetical protein